MEENQNDIPESPLALRSSLDELLDTPGSKYTKEQKVEAVSLFVTGSSLLSIADYLGIPQQTLDNWKNNTSWWPETIDLIKRDKQLELESLLTNTIHKAVEGLNDRFDNGDYKVLQKTGEIIRVPINAKDVAHTLAILYDKRALIRGEATTIRSESSSTLQNLKKNFEQFALQLKEKDVISDQ